MQYLEPPPEPKLEKKGGKVRLKKALIKTKDKSEISIDKARIFDAEEILELINGFAASNLMLPRGPQYIYENIRDFVIAVDKNIPVREGENQETLYLIVACGSLHVLWEDMAEIRSLAIHPDYQNMGLGRKIVEYMKQEAKQLGIKQLFVFTLKEKFFKALGFMQKSREELPPKVWSECSRCPKYFKCDEVGMVLEI